MTDRAVPRRALLVSLVAALCLGGCGGASSDEAESSTVVSTATSTDGEQQQEGVSGCVIADVSESTDEVRNRSTLRYSRYVETFGAFATGIGMDGSGRVCVILAAGNPLTEGAPVDVFVGPQPEHRDSPDYRGPDVQAAVGSAQAGLREVFENPARTQPGSALAEAAVVAADKLEPGDRLMFLSDGVQHSPPAGSFRAADLSSQGIELLLDRLDGRGLIPDLEGVYVEFPHLLEHPGDEADTDASAVTPAQGIDIRAFWTAWADRVGAADISFGTGS